MNTEATVLPIEHLCPLVQKVSPEMLEAQLAVGNPSECALACHA